VTSGDTFERLIYPELGSRPIAEIRRSDRGHCSTRSRLGSGPRMADECLAAISCLFNWYMSRDDDFLSPLRARMRGMRRAKPGTSARVPGFWTTTRFGRVAAAGAMGVVRRVFISSCSDDRAAV